MSNILEAIINISKTLILTDNDLNYINDEMIIEDRFLIDFIKNAFSNDFNTLDKKEQIKNQSKIFSYEGCPSQPPDLMIRNGDCIKLKRTENIYFDFKLGSSYPRAKLFSSSHLINSHCKTCEDWKEKDIIYTIGHIPNKSKTLSSLWMIYGAIYAADENIYTDLKNTTTEKIDNINFSETKKIGKVNYLDSVKITTMTITEMWSLQSPVKAFNHIYNYDAELKFQLIALIPNKKYNSFPLESRNKIENYNKISIKNIQLENPNNPINLIDCKLITIKINKD